MSATSETMSTCIKHSFKMVFIKTIFANLRHLSVVQLALDLQQVTSGESSRVVERLEHAVQPGREKKYSTEILLGS